MTNVHVATDGDLLTIRVDLTAVAKDLSHQVGEWKQTAERIRTQCEQSEWYLGEAKASIARRAEELQALREAYDQLEAGHHEVTAWLHEAERERDEAHERLRQRTEHLEAQLAQAQGEAEETRQVAENGQHQLSVERAQRMSLEAELTALRTHGERRRALRRARPDLTLELQSHDGAVLFQGLPRNISPRGVGFASEQPIIDGPTEMWVTLHQPGVARPIEALGRVAWQGPEATMGNVGGCELLDMSPGCREILERVLADNA
ncbi:MAG: hypothetical protein DMD96_01590 [Candidatus Rokuibacteriota bacterium]|nr:MAG: hypothetical protein DMD96_01590 [Candidatus Rokubacteria bacterium]